LYQKICDKFYTSTASWGMTSKMPTKAALYSVQAAAALAGVNPSTLRMWEQRYDAVLPRRTDAGHRRYDERAVERLQIIASLVRHGHAISVVAGLGTEALKQLLRRTQTPTPRAASDALGARLDALRDAVAAFDVVRAANQLRWLRTVLGARRFVLDVAVPLFAEIGELVAAEKMDVCQEHAVSAVLRDQIGDLLHTLQGMSSPDVKGGPAVFACPEDDRHEFGILLGAVLAAVRGLPVWYAGPDLPAASLAKVVTAVRAPLVVLGNTPIPAKERSLSFEAFLLDVDGRMPADVAILVGGRGDRPRLTLPSGRSLRYVNSLPDLDALFERGDTPAFGGQSLLPRRG
jgi:DNA-binding transcriptional MerR regulator